jgi:Spy/CpxP family protein refolding chaperone
MLLPSMPNQECQIMKSFLTTLVTSTVLSGLVLTSTGTAYAGYDNGRDEGKRQAHHQERAGGEHGHLRAMRFMERNLNLSDEQKAQIQAIFMANKNEEDRPQPGAGLMALDPTAADYDTQVQQLAKQQATKVEQGIVARSKVHAQVYAVLTVPQREKMKTLIQERQDRKLRGADSETSIK